MIGRVHIHVHPRTGWASPEGPEETALIRRIQDEVHRFAITYHRSLRDKRTLHSILDDIPNVGEKRRRALLMKFGSVDNIKKATVEELLEVPSIDKKSAESIYIYFNGNN